MVKTVPTRAKRAIKDAAQRGLEGARSVAGGALDAATAAADVVVETTASALDAGQAGIKRSTPAVKRVRCESGEDRTQTSAQKIDRQKKSRQKKVKREAAVPSIARARVLLHSDRIADRLG